MKVFADANCGVRKIVEKRVLRFMQYYELLLDKRYVTNDLLSLIEIKSELKGILDMCELEYKGTKDNITYAYVYGVYETVKAMCNKFL